MAKKQFTKLNNENYNAWEFEMRAVLKKKGVWSIALGEETRPVGSLNHNAVKSWVKRRDIAAGEIIERLDPGQSLIAIWRKFTWITKADNTPIHPSNTLTIVTLLGSLPKTYHPLVVALDAHPEAGDLDFVIGLVLNEAVTLEHFNPDMPSIVSPGHESTALKIDKLLNPYAKPTKPWDAMKVLADWDRPNATMAIIEIAYTL
ncbi:unnamed protein product [Cyclocybe aegerita]|uniref:DUF4219 domain-containing protein n=1 Tax=Cyclocybe aegerita TaxID=1973307 RepID=A0A8S0VTW8_CYCAE|nr:unnamed protein product [Cyclocybe aegerita]